MGKDMKMTESYKLPLDVFQLFGISRRNVIPYHRSEL